MDERWRAILSLPVDLEVHHLAAALGVDLERLASVPTNMGRFAVSFGPADAGFAPSGVRGFAVSFLWDFRHEQAATPVKDCGWRKVTELAVLFAAGRAACAAALRSEHGPPRHVRGWDVHGPWLLAASSPGGDDFTLRRFLELPEWALPPIDRARRDAALGTFAGGLRRATKDDDRLAAWPDATGTGMTIATRDDKLVVTFRPPMPALEVAEVFGWNALLTTTDIFRSSWRVGQIDQPGERPTLGPTTIGWIWIDVQLEEVPCGEPVEDTQNLRRLGPGDRVAELHIGRVRPEWFEGDVARPGDAIAARIRAFPRDLAARAAYASWLERHGFIDEGAYVRELATVLEGLEGGAPGDVLEPLLARLASRVAAIPADVLVVARAGRSRHGGLLALAPVRLALDAVPDAATVPSARSLVVDPMPFDVLVVADVLGRADARAMREREPVRVTRDTWQDALARARLRFAIEVAHRRVELAVERVDDFDEAGWPAQLVSQGLGGQDLWWAIEALARLEPLRRAERAWRSLAWLLERAPRDATVSVVHGTREDLDADGDGSPVPWLRGLAHVIHPQDHTAMSPRGLVVLDHAIDPTVPRDALLLKRLAETGRRRVVPIVAPWALPASGAGIASELDAWRTDPSAPHVTLCAPDFELHRSPRGVVRGHASFLTAALALQSFERNLTGASLLGPVESVRLVEEVDARHARAEGRFTFVSTRRGAVVASDATCASPRTAGPTGGHRGTFGPPPPPTCSWFGAERSLPAMLLLTRLAHVVADVDLRAGGTVEPADLALLRHTLGERIAARLTGIPGVRVQVEGLRWVDPGRADTASTVEAELTATIPSPLDAGGITLAETVLLRLPCRRPSPGD